MVRIFFLGGGEYFKGIDSEKIRNVLNFAMVVHYYVLVKSQVDLSILKVILYNYVLLRFNLILL